MNVPKLYAVNLNSESATMASFKVDTEFEEACAYCIDAPAKIPSGSTRLLYGRGNMIVTIPTSVWRDE